ncbi:MAG: hypothetical protein WD847_12210 [Pirellulales bacterium]
MTQQPTRFYPKRTLFTRAVSPIVLAIVTSGSCRESSQDPVTNGSPERAVVHVRRASSLANNSTNSAEKSKRTGKVRLRFVDGQDGSDEMIVENGSTNLYVVSPGRRSIREDLRTDTWVVYICAVWSTHELRAIPSVSKVADSLSGDVKVAVKTYVEYGDIEHLYPGFEPHPWKLPLWLVLSEGEVLREQSGFLSNAEVLAFVSKAVTQVRDVRSRNTPADSKE